MGTYETQVVEKVVEVPHVLREEVAVEVPQIQTAEVVRQDAVAQTREVVKQIPRVSMQYRERVVEMQEQIRQEVIAAPVQTIAPVSMTTVPAVSTAIPSMTYGTGAFAAPGVGFTSIG